MRQTLEVPPQFTFSHLYAADTNTGRRLVCVVTVPDGTIKYVVWVENEMVMTSTSMAEAVKRYNEF